MPPFASRCRPRAQWGQTEQSKARCEPTSRQLRQPRRAFRGRYTCPSADLWRSGLCRVHSLIGYTNTPHKGYVPSSPALATRDDLPPPAAMASYHKRRFPAPAGHAELADTCQQLEGSTRHGSLPAPNTNVHHGSRSELQ